MLKIVTYKSKTVFICSHSLFLYKQYFVINDEGRGYLHFVYIYLFYTMNICVRV